MKIDFEDGSFVLFDDAEHDDRKLSIIMCGLQDSRKRATMSYSTLDQDQVVDLIEFLQHWIENKKLDTFLP